MPEARAYRQSLSISEVSIDSSQSRIWHRKFFSGSIPTWPAWIALAESSDARFGEQLSQDHHASPARDAEADFNLFTLISASQAPINLPIKINRSLVEFQLDTGASLTVVTNKDFEGNTKGAVPLQKCHRHLQTYAGEIVVVLGDCNVKVIYGKQKAKLPLVLVEGEGPTLLGRNWQGEL